MSHLNHPLKRKQNSGELPTPSSASSAERITGELGAALPFSGSPLLLGRDTGGCRQRLVLEILEMSQGERMQGATGGVAKEGIVQVDCKGSGGLLEGRAVLRRGSGQGGPCAGVGRGRWEPAVQPEQKDVGGPCEGRDGDAGALTQVCCVPESRWGQVPVKVKGTRTISVRFSAAQSLPQGGGSPGRLPSQR